jgi:predicted Zn-dependent peptidase
MERADMMYPGYNYAYSPMMQPEWNYPQAQVQPAYEVGPVMGGQLANGAKGYFQQVPNQKQSNLSIFLPISPAMAGIRELLPGLMTMGNERIKYITSDLQTKGINFGVVLSGDMFQLSLNGPAGREADLMQAAMTILHTPLTEPPVHFNALKEDTVKGYQSMMSDPNVPLSEAIMQGLYGKGHPYAKTVQEVINDVSRQSAGSVLGMYRQILQSTGQINMIMVSPQSVESQQGLLNQAIHQFSWYPNPYRPAILPQVPAVPNRRGSRAPMLIPNENVDQAYILSSWKAIQPNDPDYPAFCVLRNMLEGSAGRFFKILRTEKGLVYGSNLAYSLQKYGADYSVNIQVDYDKIDSGLQGIQQVVQSFITAPVSQAELRMAKKKFNLEMNSAKQLSEGISSFEETWLQNDLTPQHPETFRTAIDMVNANDIQRVANRLFNPTNGYQVTGVTAPKQILMQWQASKLQSARSK